MSKVLVYYWFEETHDNGITKAAQRVEQDEIRSFLIACEIPSAQEQLALTITAQTPNVPFDLHKADSDGRIYWTARLTLKVSYRG